MPNSARKSLWKPGAIVLLSGIILGTSSCGGLIVAGASRNILLAEMFSAGFYIGAAATLLASIVLLVQLIVWFLE